jgi:hypothetical protein
MKVVNEKSFLLLNSFDIKAGKQKTIEEFHKEEGKNFSFFHPELKSVSSKSETIPLEGKVLNYRILGIVHPMTFEDYVEYLNTTNHLFLGSQAILLAWKNREQFPKEKWSISPDQKSRLYKDAGGNYRIPRIRQFSSNCFSFGLAHLQDVLGNDSCLVHVAYK